MPSIWGGNKWKIIKRKQILIIRQKALTIRQMIIQKYITQKIFIATIRNTKPIINATVFTTPAQ